MNRELAEVRRYWPKAKPTLFKRVGRRHPPRWAVVCGMPWYTRHLQVCGSVGRYAVATVPPAGEAPMQLGAACRTISAAMRAAGFGVRPLGEFAGQREMNAQCRLHIMDDADDPAELLAYYRPRLADRQRERKGARLGARRRREACDARAI